MASLKLLNLFIKTPKWNQHILNMQKCTVQHSDLKWNHKNFSRKVSGYESETAEIQDSLNNLSINYEFDFDKPEKFDANVEHDCPKSLPMMSIKSKSSFERNNEFIDFLNVHVKGGNGGNGMICFLQLWSNPNAGPSGGDGGNGGHVIFEACNDIKSLNRVKTSYNGQNGENGMHKDMTGKNAEHIIVKVPVGTLIKDRLSKKLIANMNMDGIRFLAARGGCGGKGNHYFLSNKNRHPRVAEIGATGEKRSLILELKIIAQAGLVGFPNVGKSTLLSAISRAKPKVANYPFTTLKPFVGIVQYDDMEQLSVADLPGIIEDAHKNRGLGFDFLKHVERCVCLFYVIDISQANPYYQFQTLVKELEHYKKDLSKRPVAVVVNKMDVEDSKERLQQFVEKLKEDNLSHLRVIPVSAKYGSNLTELLVYFRQLYDRYIKLNQI